jgi:putative DNA primase/helicase
LSASVQALAPASPLAGKTEDEIALLFAERFKDELRYCHSNAYWYSWQRSIWKKESTNLAFDLARQVCREVNRDGQTTIAKASTAKAVELFARADRHFAVEADIWDNDPMKLGTPDQTVDLLTGDSSHPSPRDFITRSTSDSPANDEYAPNWQKFINEVTKGDLDLQNYLKRCFGYFLTGLTREHALFFFIGPGGNGKSVFLNVLTEILGDYAVTAAMETFTATRNEQHSTGIAMLQGARLVTASETEEGGRWAESRIKSMTGGDPLTARFMRMNFFTYIPQFKAVIVGNHYPSIHNVDAAMRRRLHIIPFDFRPEVPDMDLPEKLQAEYPQILRWAINGCLEWQKTGLCPPPVVKDATERYFDNQDLFGTWLSEGWRIEDGNANIFHETSKLFKAWKQFATDNGEDSGSSKSFNAAMVKRGFQTARKYINGKSNRVYLGIQPDFNPKSSGIDHG